MFVIKLPSPPQREGDRFLKIFLKYLKKIALPNNSSTFLQPSYKLNTIKNTYNKHMPLILPKIRILFINKKISLVHIY